MAVAYGTIQTANNGFTTSLVLTKPTSTAENDFLYMSVAVQRADVTVTTPSGWTKLYEDDTGAATAGDLKLVTFYKLAGASEPANYTVTISSTGWMSGGIIRLTGADSGSPVGSDNQEVESATSLASPGVTTTTANGMYVLATARRDAGGDSPSVSGFTNRGSTSISSIRIDFVTKAAPTAGSSGTVTADYSNTQDDIILHLIALDAAPVDHDGAGEFRPTVDFQASLQKYLHNVGGQFQVPIDFAGFARGDKEVAGEFRVAADFQAAAYWEVSGEFKIAIDMVNTGFLRDFNVAGSFLVATDFAGVGSVSPHRLRGEFRVPIRFSDGYVGKGTGLIWTFPASVTPAEEKAYELNKFLASLREGDEFPGYFPLAGINGKTGKVRVVARRYNDALETPDLDVQFIELQDPALIARLKEDTVIPFIPQRQGNLFRDVIEFKRRFSRE